ncbi:MAG TPA: VOC family protein [Thermomicrobiales bacterium]|nr:VOC family protein [Thermomicrobiales bacterium]
MPEPAMQHGRICYLELPANDVIVSAEFYRDVFGWEIRERDDGVVVFWDGGNQLQGVFATGLAAAGIAGPRLYIWVDDALDCSNRIERAGGTIMMEANPTLVHIDALFRDPAGNLLGIHEHNPENA